MTNPQNADHLNNLSDAVLDLTREHRKGVPEIIFTSSKDDEQSLAIAERFLEHNGRAILSRVSSSLEAKLVERYGADGLEWYRASHTAIVRRGPRVERKGGRVGILTAGTSDRPAAEEAAIVCQEMGCKVTALYDVGVAGLHRLFEPLRQLLHDDDVDVLIVAAGMDGALPSVVSGLVDVPVVGLPTSVGYGMGGKGRAALLAMLQTCSPGLAVVNIDNGVGAGVTAALIANRAEKQRAAARQSAGPAATE
ncbi:MAG: nickel pincer cofactor biosynthesis protein LarB [Anaerolineae bacterium]